MKIDLFKMVTEFYDNPVLPKAVIASFLAMIPKVEIPVLIEDFRHICLIRSMYRILSKLIAERLKKVMSKLISRVSNNFYSR